MDGMSREIIKTTILVMTLISMVCGQQPGIRLVNGPTNTSGRVEIFDNEVWHTVCDDNFDRNALKVVCRMVGVELNDSYGVFHHMAYLYGPGTGDNFYDSYSCTGQESNILSCPGISTTHDCQHIEDVGVDCSVVRIGAECREGGDRIFHDPCGGVTTQCISGTCTCAEGYGDNNGPSPGGVCIIECGDDQFAANVTTCDQKIPLGEFCPNPSEVYANETCADKNAKCVIIGNSSDYTCQCRMSYFDDNGPTTGGVCKPKLALGEDCSDPILSGLDSAVQCAAEKSECFLDGSSHRCKCIPNYYDDNGQTTEGGQCRQKLALNQSCPGTISKNDTCREPNSVCLPKGTSNTYTCVCNVGYYTLFGSDGTNVGCAKEHSYGEVCTADKQCSTWLANCLEDNDGAKKCACPHDYTFNETSNECKGKEITHCPGDTTSGIVWGNTPLETVAYENCPEGYEGTVSRYCTKDGVFRKPLLNCSLLAFKDTLEQVLNSNGTVDTGEILEKLVQDVKVPDKIYAGDAEVIENILKTAADAGEGVVDKEQIQNVANIVNILINPEDTDAYAGRLENTGKGAEGLLDTVDTFIGNAAKNLENDTEVETPNMHVKITKTDDKTNKTELNFALSGGKNDSNDTKPSVSLKVAAIKGKNITSFAVIVYRDVSKILPQRFEKGKDEDQKASIESKVMSVNLYPKQPEELDPPLELEFPIQPPEDGMDTFCSFLNLDKGAWSTKGCRKVSSSKTSVRCQCEHLTNFAVIVSPARPTSESQKTALSILSMVGCGISMTFLLITMIANGLYWRHIKSDSNTLPMVLCGILFVGYCLFVFGVNHTESKAVCTTIAVLLHYTFLLVFFVMLAEGLYITIRVVFIFHVQSHVKGLLIAAFILPAIVVGIAMSVTKLDGYGDDEYCWLAYGHWVFWTFAGPAALIVLVNMVILGIVLVKMYGTSWIQNMDFRKRTKTMAQKLAFLVPLLGVTWLFGFLAVNEDTFALQVLFLLSNCLQGPVIFVFHVLLNKQLKTAIQAAGKRKQTMDDLSTDTKRHGKDDGTSTVGHSTHATETSFVSKDFRSETDDNVKMIRKEHPEPSAERRPSIEEKVITENIADKNVRKSTLMKLQTELRGRLNNMFTTVKGRASTIITSKKQNTDDQTLLHLDLCDETELPESSPKNDAEQTKEPQKSYVSNAGKLENSLKEKEAIIFTGKSMLKTTSSLVDLENMAAARSSNTEIKVLNKTRSSHALGSLIPAMSFDKTVEMLKSDFKHDNQKRRIEQMPRQQIAFTEVDGTVETAITLKANERLSKLSSNLTPIDENADHSSSTTKGSQDKDGKCESINVMGEPTDDEDKIDTPITESITKDPDGAKLTESIPSPFDTVSEDKLTTNKLDNSENETDLSDESPAKSNKETYECNLVPTIIKSVDSSDSCGSVSSDSDASSDTDDGNPKSYAYVINPFDGDDAGSSGSDNPTVDSDPSSEKDESITSDRL